MAIRIRQIKTRDEWLSWRRANINASEIGALMGVNKYSTPLALYHEKRGTMPPETDPQALKRMQRGQWLEPAVIAAVASEHPDWEVEPQKHYYDDQALRIGCTPDAFIWSGNGRKRRKGVLQCKSVSWQAWRAGWWDADTGQFTPPLHYQLQTLIEAKLTGAEYAVLAALILLEDGTIDLEIFDIELHHKMWLTVCDAVKTFWANHAKGIAPKVIPAYDDETVKRLYPEPIPDSIIDLSGDNELPGLIAEDNRLAAAISALKKPLSPLDKERKEIRTQITAKIGGHEYAKAGPWLLRWRHQHNEPSDFRVLSIKPASKEGKPHKVTV